MILSTFTEWPRWIGHPATGEWRVFNALADIPPEWIAALTEAERAAAHVAALDHDGDGRMGGGPVPKKRGRPRKA